MLVKTKHIRAIIFLMGVPWVSYAEHGQDLQLDGALASHAPKSYSNRDEELEWQSQLAQSLGVKIEDLKRDLDFDGLSEETKEALKKLTDNLSTFAKHGKQKSWLDKLAKDKKLSEKEIQKIKDASDGIKDDELLANYWKKVSPVLDAYNEVKPTEQQAKAEAKPSESAQNTLGQLAATINSGSSIPSTVNTASNSSNIRRSPSQPQSNLSIKSLPVLETTPSTNLADNKSPILTQNALNNASNSASTSASTKNYTYIYTPETNTQLGTQQLSNVSNPSVFSKTETTAAINTPKSVSRSPSSIDNSAIYQPTASDSSSRLLESALEASSAPTYNQDQPNDPEANTEANSSPKETYSISSWESPEFSKTKTADPVFKSTPSLSGLKKPDSEPSLVELPDPNALAYNSPFSSKESQNESTSSILLLTQQKKNKKPATSALYSLYNSIGGQKKPEKTTTVPSNTISTKLNDLAIMLRTDSSM